MYIIYFQDIEMKGKSIFMFLVNNVEKKTRALNLNSYYLISDHFNVFSLVL
jgi:hypothetical protein